MNHKFPIFLTLISGAAMPYAFAPYHFWWLGFVALAAWLYLLLKHPQQWFKLGLAFGFGWFGFGAWWLADTLQIYGHLPYALGLLSITILGLIMSMFFVAWAWLLQALLRHQHQALWLFPALGVLVEWVRSFLFTGLPWTALANLSSNTAIASWISIMGSYGAAFIILLMASSLTLLFYANTRKYALISASMCALFWLFSPTISLPEHPTHTAALIQPNIPQDQKWDANFLNHTMQTLTTLSAQAANTQKLDLIIWPEAAVPFYLSRSPSWNHWLTTQMQSWQTPVIFGGIKLLDSGKSQNGLFLEHGDATRQFVGKHHLVPFGEYVPSWLPWLSKLVPDIGDFEPATDQGMLKLGSQTIGSIICYESIFPDEVRHRVSQGANVLVVVTNDAWYDTSPAAWQHLQASQIRAIESGRYILRATNTGISAIIAPDGSIQNTMPWWQKGIVIGHYQPLSHITLYQQWGDTPILTLVFFLLILGGYQRWQHQRKRSFI